MDRSVESKAFRRGLAAGLLALIASLGGQVLSRSHQSCTACTGDGVLTRVVERVRPAVRAHAGVAQRVAFAVLGAVLERNCS